ncbi:MAG: cysteine desulfurase family protein [Alphaproteobacteria bacterium]
MASSVMRVYLDNAATTPVRPEVKAAMVGALDVFGNPSSVHGEGQAARMAVDGARKAVGELIGVRAERVVLTSGGTEAANLALRSVVGRGRVVVSAVEHDCVLETAKALGGTVVPVDGDGVVRLEALEDELKRGGVALVSVMHANNETGVLMPVAEVAALAHKYGALCHTDAVQTVGHVDVNMDALGVDMLSLTAHKFGGPKGVGVLVVKSEVQDRMVAQMTGGAQERNRRAGTENVVGIVGLGAAVKALDVARERETVAGLMERFVAGLEGLPLEVVAPKAAKVGHVVQLVGPMLGEDMVMALDMQGVAVSQGSACSSGRVAVSHVLRAMGVEEGAARRAFRVSMGWGTSPRDVEQMLATMAGIFKK